MSRFLLLLLCVLVSACSPDLLLPCDGNGPVGKMCREYRFFNGTPIGYVEFEYEGDTTVISRTYNTGSELVKTLIHRYENGKLTLVAEQFPDQESRVESWHYYETDSLWQIIYGANDSLLRVEFDNDVRHRLNYFRGDTLHRWVDHRYYSDDGKLYRKSYFDHHDSLHWYQNFQYFSTGQYRVSDYSADHEFLGRTVFGFSQLGLITSKDQRNAAGDILSSAEYIYDVAGKLIESTTSEGDNSSKSVYLYY